MFSPNELSEPFFLTGFRLIPASDSPTNDPISVRSRNGVIEGPLTSLSCGHDSPQLSVTYTLHYSMFRRLFGHKLRLDLLFATGMHKVPDCTSRQCLSQFDKK